MIISGVALIESIANVIIIFINGAAFLDWLSVTGSAVSVFFYFLVLWGAIKYHRCAVIVTLMWQCVAFCLLIAGLSLAITTYDDEAFGQETSKNATIITISIGIVVKFGIIYAYSTFISEVGSGVMSPETHDREKCECNSSFILVTLMLYNLDNKR
jgi:hypothetical protein